MAPETLLTTAQIHQGVGTSFRNSSSEIFVGSIGEQHADTINFYNIGVGGQQNAFSYSASAAGMIKKVEL